ncbi:MAG: hypothetical protein ACFHVJ_05870 [Aestuariibacter sp.]
MTEQRTRKYHSFLIPAPAFFAVLCLWFFLPSTNAAEDIQFSGFARVIGGATDSDMVAYEGYNESFRMSNQSLIALQLEQALSERLTIATQLLAHGSDERDSGVEWLYLRYQASPNWRVKAGKLRSSFLNYSDVVDVGFAYPWITPPQQVYTSYFFSSYEGVNASYDYATSSFNLNLEFYFGSFDDAVVSANTEIDTSIDFLKGTIATFEMGQFKLRGSVHHSTEVTLGLNSIDVFSDLLAQQGFVNSARSLDTSGSVIIRQAGLSYDDLKYFFATEWLNIDSQINIAPEVSAYYVMVGRHWNDISFHFTVGELNNKPGAMVNEIPLGVSPQLDFLALQYQNIFRENGRGDYTSTTLGIRWDFRSKMAMKAEWTRISGEPDQANFQVSQLDTFPDDQTINLLQIGLEWVF